MGWSWSGVGRGAGAAPRAAAPATDLSQQDALAAAPMPSADPDDALPGQGPTQCTLGDMGQQLCSRGNSPELCDDLLRLHASILRASAARVLPLVHSPRSDLPAGRAE